MNVLRVSVVESVWHCHVIVVMLGFGTILHRIGMFESVVKRHR